MAFKDLPRDAQKAFFAKLRERAESVASLAAKILLTGIGLGVALRSPAARQFLGEHFDVASGKSTTLSSIMTSSSPTMLGGIAKMKNRVPSKVLSTALNVTPDLRDTKALSAVFKGLPKKKAMNVLRDVNREIDVAFDSNGKAIGATSINKARSLSTEGLIKHLPESERARVVTLVHNHPVTGFRGATNSSGFSGADIQSFGSSAGNFHSYTRNKATNKINELYLSTDPPDFPNLRSIEVVTGRHTYYLGIKKGVKTGDIKGGQWAGLLDYSIDFDKNILSKLVMRADGKFPVFTAKNEGYFNVLVDQSHHSVINVGSHSKFGNFSDVFEYKAFTTSGRNVTGRTTIPQYSVDPLSKYLGDKVLFNSPLVKEVTKKYDVR